MHGAIAEKTQSVFIVFVRDFLCDLRVSAVKLVFTRRHWLTLLRL